MNHEKETAHFAAILLAADLQFLHVSDVEKARRREAALDQARQLLKGATPPGWELQPTPKAFPMDPVKEDPFTDPGMGEPWKEKAEQLLRETGEAITEHWNSFTEEWGREVISLAPGPAVTVVTDRVVHHCRKVVVRATLVTEFGRIFISENHTEVNPGTCPREGMAHGEGYHLCREVCHQKGHAETNVLGMAGDQARGGVLYLQGHDRLCRGCAEACAQAEVTVVRQDGVVLLRPAEDDERQASLFLRSEARANG